MSSLWFSRIRLNDDASVRAIAPLLLPDTTSLGDASPLAPRHKLIWSLFADHSERQRDFLWREDKHGIFYTLSERPPESEIFTIDTKPYEPQLRSGDKLAFTLRANPVVSKKLGKVVDVTSKTTGITRSQRKIKKVDVVMAALNEIKVTEPLHGNEESQSKARIRQELVQQKGGEWLQKQAAIAGFEIEHVICDGYKQHLLPKKKGGETKSAMKFSTIEFQGRLKITDPEQFLKRVQKGMGSAKAYGCGLMLLKRI